MPSIDQTIIQAKVTLQDIEPPIWRRLLLPPSLNLAELHHVLQAAFGWRDQHLHEFIIGGLVYGAPELDDSPPANSTSRCRRHNQSRSALRSDAPAFSHSHSQKRRSRIGTCCVRIAKA